MAKERLAYFDNVKGVLIALVVIGHLLEPCAKLGAEALAGFKVLDFIYMFHMPLFIFVTGLFSNSVFKQGRFRAEVPLFYFAICFLMYTGLMVEKLCLGSEVSFNYLTLNGRIPWYLMVAGFYVLGVPFFARLKPSVALGGAVWRFPCSLVSSMEQICSRRRGLLRFCQYFSRGFICRLRLSSIR